MRGDKDTPEYLKSEDYVKNMDQATRMKVILSDTDTQQHWLSDGASVVLHLCRAWLSKKHTRYAPEGVADQIWYPAAAAGPLTSFETLTSDANRALQLYTSDLKLTSKAPALEDGSEVLPDEPVIEKEWFLLQHQAQYFYHWLEQIHDRMVRARHSADIDLIREGNKAIGFEFKDLLRGDSPVEPYTIALGRGAEAWLPFAKSMNAIHIHAAGLGELIRHSSTTQVEKRGTCGRQGAAPLGVDHLVAPLSVLREGIERLQHTSTCAQLSRGLYWQEVEELFKDCHCRRSYASAQCKALVKKLHGKSSKTSDTRRTTLLPSVFEQHPMGAIILGYESQVLVKAPPVDTVPASVSRCLRGDNGKGKRPAQPERHSDSGYGSHVGSSSHASQTSSLGAETPSPENYNFLGAANEPSARKLTKRRKTDR